jgi:hypothetical protein
MMPFVPLRPRLAAPLLFLLVVGGAIAIADYWMRCQPRPAPAMRRSPATPPEVRHAPVRRRRRTPGGGA